MNISYNVYVPEKKFFGRGKSAETAAVDGFLSMKSKQNMCFEYDTPEEAKKKMSTVRNYSREHRLNEKIDIFRDENRIYIVKKEGEKK